MTAINKNDGTPPLHEFFVPGLVDQFGPAYVYCMTSNEPTIDSFIRDLSMAVRYESPEEFIQDQRIYPGLRALKLFKVGVIGEVK